MNEEKLSMLIEQAAISGELPEIRNINRPHSPGFLDVYLCGVEVECFDTYYYTAAQKANDLALSIKSRIIDCTSIIIKSKDKRIAELEKALSHSEKELDSLKLDSNLTYEVLMPIISDFIDDECDHCDIAHALKKALAIRDLDKFSDGVAALGCYIVNNGEEIPEEHLQVMVDTCINEQAQALKEKGNEIPKAQVDILIDFVDFCIADEGIDQSVMEVAFMHYIKALKEKSE